MKTIIAALVIACTMTLPLTSFGETVEHHGMRVDADSPPEACTPCHHVSAHRSHPIFIECPPRVNEKEYADAAHVQA